MCVSKPRVIKVSYCSHFQSVFLLSLVECFRALKNLSCRVVWWSGWWRMERGCGRASHKHQREGCCLPLPVRTRISLTGKCVTVAGKSGSSELTRWDNRGACLSAAAGCLSFTGGKIEELLVAYGLFWDTALLSCLYLLLKRVIKTIGLWVHGGIMTEFLAKQVWCNSE